MTVPVIVPVFNWAKAVAAEISAKTGKCRRNLITNLLSLTLVAKFSASRETDVVRHLIWKFGECQSEIDFVKSALTLLSQDAEKAKTACLRARLRIELMCLQ